MGSDNDTKAFWCTFGCVYYDNESVQYKWLIYSKIKKLLCKIKICHSYFNCVELVQHNLAKNVFIRRHPKCDTNCFYYRI